ncbi:hypothetical protein [Hoylesella loescheii]|nr:hypothetical protein [Hoylesella loescheii]
MVNWRVWDKKPCPLNKNGQVRNGFLANYRYATKGITIVFYPELA